MFIKPSIAAPHTFYISRYQEIFMITNSPTVDKKVFSSYLNGVPAAPLLEMYFHEDPNPKVFKPLHPLLSDFLHSPKDKTMLDLGCGLGSTFAEGALHYGLPPEQLVSLDYYTENFKEDHYNRLNKIAASAEQLPFKKNTFNIVHSSMLTADNPSIDYPAVLEEIARVLKPEGFYIAFEFFDNNEIKKKEHPKKLGYIKEYIHLLEQKHFLEKKGFSRMERIPYYFNGKSPFSFMFYLFVKECIRTK